MNIKFYGEDKSLYYSGGTLSFGSGGFNFTTEKESRGDASLLVGNSGQGDYLNADAFLQASDFSKSLSKGINFGSNKGIVEYFGNIIEGLNKGMKVGEKVNEAFKSSNSSAVNQSSTNGQSGMVTMQRTDYSATKPSINNGSVLHTPYPRDTTVVKGNEQIVIKNNTNDSLKAVRLRDLRNSR